jgi:methylenetetrahydrofolate dehydrogenase (NADP+)/methenyltetrahydrofolate cyclohydrolase
MPAKLIDGKAIAKQIKEELNSDIEELKAKGITPGLAAVLVGDDPASHIYVRSKSRACKKLGIYSEVIERPADFKREDLNKLIDELNERSDIHGILIQSPLPKHLDELEAVMYVRKRTSTVFIPSMWGICFWDPRYSCPVLRLES